jgi:hypothetical protein
MSTNLMAGKSARAFKLLKPRLSSWSFHYGASSFRFLQTASTPPVSHVDPRLRSLVMKIREDFDLLVGNREENIFFRHFQSNDIRILNEISHQLEEAENEMAEIYSMQNGKKFYKN